MGDTLMHKKNMFGFLFFLLLCSRLFLLGTFVFLSIDCLKFKVIIEQCRNRSSSGDAGQALDIAGPFMEAASSVSYLIVLFSWSRFFTRTFFRILPRTHGFWFWQTMAISYVVSVVSFCLTQGQLLLGLGLILEVFTASLLCCALKYVDRATVKHSLRSSSSESYVLYGMYIASLWLYIFRNLTVFAYDTSLLIGQIQQPGKFANITRLLLCFNCAIRGSFVQAFYYMLFKNPTIPKVCDNVNSCMLYDLYGSVGVNDCSGGRQPLIRWETPIEEAIRHVQIQTLG